MYFMEGIVEYIDVEGASCLGNMGIKYVNDTLNREVATAIQSAVHQKAISRKLVQMVGMYSINSFLIFM